MHILCIFQGFLDYRVPVFAELDRLTKGELTVIYGKTRTPERVVKKIEAAIGSRAVGLSGERIIHWGDFGGFANKGIAIPYQRGLLKEVLSRKADVVIADGFFQWAPAALSKKIIQKVPLVVNYEKTAHTERHCPRWRVTYRKTVLRFVDSVVCNGSLCADYVASLGMSPDRIVTGGIAADGSTLKAACERVSESERQNVRDTLGLPRPVFLYIGRMIKLKGVAEMLRGWEIYKNQDPNQASLLLVGDGDQRHSLERWVETRQLPDVHFVGWVDYDSIAQYYAAADVFIIPTLEDNWSLVVPEAMACGLPIACSKYNGCWPELVRDGENGLVFDPNNAYEVANTFRSFAEKVSELPKMGHRSQEIESNFSATKAAQAILKACNIALAKKCNR